MMGNKLQVARIPEASFGDAHSGYPRYAVVNWLFLRILGLIYIAAFASMAIQVEGLVGVDGILPIESKLAAIRESLGPSAYWMYPSIFWVNASDPVLFGACLVGVLGGVAVLSDRFTRGALVACYGLYLSLVFAGQDFMRFQWDMFLLEAGFLAILLCSGSTIIVFLFRWLLFRFMFLSGLVKVASGDAAWTNLTALLYHYETQPLPTPLAWYVHHLPLWIHQVCVAGVLLIELVVAFFIFAPGRLRLAAAGAFILLQSAIILTGNYNFFNLLTILLCLFLFDDSQVSRLVGSERASRIENGSPRPGRWGTSLAATFAFIVLLSNATLGWSSYYRTKPVQPFYGVMAATLTLGIANTYGPFAVMTRNRGEIEIQASMDGVTWFPYEFRYKPGSLDTDLGWLIPHQPRLDWQMWFAALRPERPPFWFYRLIHQLDEASPAVERLFLKVPFSGQRPAYLRARFYRYSYSSPGQRAATGHVWVRQLQHEIPLLE